jgi:hypothetical protein
VKRRDFRAVLIGPLLRDEGSVVGVLELGGGDHTEGAV